MNTADSPAEALGDDVDVVAGLYCGRGPGQGGLEGRRHGKVSTDQPYLVPHTQSVGLGHDVVHQVVGQVYLADLRSRMII